MLQAHAGGEGGGAGSSGGSGGSGVGGGGRRRGSSGGGLQGALAWVRVVSVSEGREPGRRPGGEDSGRVHVESALLQHGRARQAQTARDRPETGQRASSAAARLCSAMRKPAPGLRRGPPDAPCAAMAHDDSIKHGAFIGRTRRMLPCFIGCRCQTANVAPSRPTRLHAMRRCVLYSARWGHPPTQVRY